MTDFTDSKLISVSKRPFPTSNPPTTTFGRYVLQVTFWDDAGRGNVIKNLRPGDLIKIENLHSRLDRGCLFGHVNPSKYEKSEVPLITVLKSRDPTLGSLLRSARPFSLSRTPRKGGTY